jgi:hypothetical protein
VLQANHQDYQTKLHTEQSAERTGGHVFEGHPMVVKHEDACQDQNTKGKPPDLPEFISMLHDRLLGLRREKPFGNGPSRSHPEHHVANPERDS